MRRTHCPHCGAFLAGDDAHPRHSCQSYSGRGNDLIPIRADEFVIAPDLQMTHYSPDVAGGFAADVYSTTPVRESTSPSSVPVSNYSARDRPQHEDDSTSSTASGWEILLGVGMLILIGLGARAVWVAAMHCVQQLLGTV